PSAHYMELHQNLQWRDRRELVDRFLSYSIKFRIPMETVFLAINFVDRFLSRKCAGKHLEVLGSVAFTLAVKYETPDVHEKETETYLSVLHDLGGFGKGYRPSDISSIERQLLGALDYLLGTPSPFFFLRRMQILDKSSQDILTIAQYLAASSMLYEEFLGIRPSQIASASYFLAESLL
ncbi:cyclin-like protein, partial [Colletotrichum godetiae]